MVGEKDVKARLSSEVGEPACVWLMPRCRNRSSDSTDGFLPWITRFGWLCGAESSIVRNVTGGQSGQNNLSTINTDGRPLIIQHSYAGGADHVQILLIHHPLMISEGEKGRCDGGAGRQEGQDVGLGSYRTRIIHWPAAVQNISGDTDEGRTVTL